MLCGRPHWGASIGEEYQMSRSIHWTYKIFKNKSKKEIIAMCDYDNPDYAVVELWKKMRIKRSVKEKRAEAKIERNLE